MNSLDILGILILLFFALLQAYRGRDGMGRPFFEMLGGIIAIAATISWSEGLARSLGVAEWLSLLLLFIFTGFFSFLFANLLANIAEWSFGSLDSFFSFFFGLALGWAVAYFLFRFLVLILGKDSAFAYNLEDSRLAKEILEFKFFKSLLGLLYRARLGPEITPE